MIASRGHACGRRVVLASLSLVAAGAATALLGAPATADTVDPDSPGVEYRFEDLNLPVETLHFPSGTVSGGVVEDGKKFTLAGNVLFEKDSAKLTPKAKAELANLTKRIKKQQPESLKVEGYTDNVRGKVDNTKLSKDRAKVIAKQLKRSFPKAKISSAGYGDQNPVGDNGTEEGKQLNRRVEVTAN
ncbi:MAG: OmpA family protein [Galactobacter sp.]|uniref:OmpA family protein n=1 Tax=Galactobacter sp. TaxID=2676125 RepID=UPI0025C39C74|nr:OmpA family protein [Galactobacter sp.]